MTHNTDNPNKTGHAMPEPPYYTVIFTSERTDIDDGYAETAQHMLELAVQQPGFLGVESARDDALGITVSYWKDQASIAAWPKHSGTWKPSSVARKNGIADIPCALHV